jgi:3-methyladenine DNA glycosylase/8-oxoguanine DNA glycosylase
VAIGAAHTEAIETSIRPRGPYWLSASARRAGDRTRRVRDGVLTCVFETEGAPAHARVWQDTSGVIQIRLQSPEPEAALDALRFVLAVEDDHTEFLRRFGSDRFIGMATFRLRGLRPLRTATVTHALLRALCGQLISAREARRIEARCIAAAAPVHAGLNLPPNRSTYASWSPARLCSHGLVARKASALVRISRSVDLERLRNVATDAAVRRIEQERMLGPWSAGVICLEGLGRYEQGLVGDLGLMRLCTRLLGREATVEDTVELLRPYGEWAGLASIYLLASAA